MSQTITVVGNLTVEIDAKDQAEAKAIVNAAFGVSNASDPLVGARIKVGDQDARVLGFVSYGIEILGTPLRRKAATS